MTNARRFPVSETPFRCLLTCSFLLHVAIAVICCMSGLWRSAQFQVPLYQVDLIGFAPADISQQKASHVIGENTGTQQKPPPLVEKRVKDAIPTPGNKAKTVEQTTAKGYSAQELSESLAKISQSVDEHAFKNALDGLKQKSLLNTTPSGMVQRGDGESKGSIYDSTIRALLRRAFVETISYKVGRPTTSVRIFIDRDGKLIQLQLEKSSGDKLFDDSVQRAVNQAKAKFPATPDGCSYERLFVFTPETGTVK